MNRIAPALLTALVVAFTAACTPPAPEPAPTVTQVRTPTMAELEPSTAEATPRTSELGDGFVTPQGTTLSGEVTRLDHDEVTGWVATLLLDEGTTLDAAAKDLIAQAKKAGMRTARVKVDAERTEVIGETQGKSAKVMSHLAATFTTDPSGVTGLAIMVTSEPLQGARSTLDDEIAALEALKDPK